METIDYYVVASGVINRGLFYNYIHDLGYKDDGFSREYMINSTYPFGICIRKKKLVIIESATLCYYAQKDGKIKTVEEIKQILNSKGDITNE